MTVCQAFETVGDTSRIEAEKYIPVFKNAWEKLDPEGKGVINRNELAALIASLPRPLGCLHSTKFEAEIMMRHITNHDSTFDYSFTSILLGLNVYSLVQEHNNGDPVTSTHTYNPVETLRAIRVVRRALRHKVMRIRAYKASLPGTITSAIMGMLPKVTT